MSEAPPRILPIFPLTGALLLPGGRLPLHVFERRYRNMVEDVLDGDQFIGMIQPCSGVEEIEDEDTGEADAPELYSVGCAGSIERWETLSGGRYFILLKGVHRFEVRRELELEHGYRRVEADYAAFAVDIADGRVEMVSDRLMRALGDFAESHQVSLELDKLKELPGLALLNSVAMTFPFPPAEKQALLEAPDVIRRHEMLLALIGMGIDLQGRDEPPVLH